MIRWRFLITRVLIVVAILMLLRWSLGPLAHFASVQTLQKSVGARVDIAQTRVGFFPPRLQYVDLAIGDPRSDKEKVNAFEAQTVDFVLDGNELLHRRWVVADGRISGIHIGGERSTSGHLEPVEPPTDSGPSFVGKWLGGLGDQTIDHLKAAADDLETVKRSEQIRQRWKQEYADLAKRAKSLEDDVRAIRDEARGIDNPLRDLPRLQATIQRAEAIHREALAIRQRMDALPAQVQADWVAMDEAKRIDLEKVNQYLPAPIESPEKIGPELFRDIVQQQVKSVRDYLASAREIADWTVAKPENDTRPRGDDVRLVAAEPPPGLLIRQCRLDGVLSAGGDAFTMTGILENVTPETHRLTEPLRARLRLEGPRVVRVDYQRHYTGSDSLLPRDVLTVHWPNLKLREQSVGNSDDVRLAIGGGNLDLYVQIEAIGDTMRGQLVSRQAESQLRLEANPKFAKLAAVQSLQRSLADVDHVEIQAKFAGTWSDMDMSLATNLTGALSRGLSDAATQQIAESRRQLGERVDSEHRQQMAKLQEWLGEQQATTRELLAKADAEIDSLKNKLASELPGAGTYIGKLRSLRDIR